MSVRKIAWRGSSQCREISIIINCIICNCIRINIGFIMFMIMIIVLIINNRNVLIYYQF